MSEMGRVRAVLDSIERQWREAADLGLPREAFEDLAYNASARVERALGGCLDNMDRVRIAQRFGGADAEQEIARLIGGLR
jgi:hypothetical protein